MRELDKRTKAYLDKVKENIGLMGINSGRDGIEELLKQNGLYENSKLRKIGSYSIYYNSNGEDIYEYYKDNVIRYCVEIYYESIDDYYIDTLIFSKYPSKEMITMAVDINSLEFKIMFNRLSEVYNCWDCGYKTHWLDTNGNFAQKLNNITEQHCGC